MTETKKKATSKKSVTSEVTPKKATPKPRAKKIAIEGNPQERYEAIQYAAYFIAESNGFVGDPLAFWAEAENQIDTAKS
jgi:hypothetical protein